MVEATRDPCEQFLNDWPLLQRFKYLIGGSAKDAVIAGSLFSSRISRRCTERSTCAAVPTTTWTRMSAGGAWMQGGLKVVYRCDLCQNAWAFFWILVDAQVILDRGETFTKVELRKVGQWPPWSIDPPKEVEKALTGEEALTFYRKALICMSQAFGVGAVAYLRRVVENTTSLLLHLVEELAKAQDDATSLAAIAEARATKHASERLALAARAIPPALALYGRNPLADLHDAYSAAFHAESEEACVDIAMRLRGAFDYLFTQLGPVTERAKAYRDEMAKRGRG